MNLSAVPSIYNAPVLPDFWECDPYYSSAFSPELSDCDIALQLLPVGNSDINWTLNHQGAPDGLPYIVRHGTCEIKFQASGPAANELETIDFAPNKIRNMASWVIDQCVSARRCGGFVTAEISNTINYITYPDMFHEDPFLPETTFLSLIVWNSQRDNPSYNAGDMDPETGDMILAALEDAYEGEPSWSPLKVNIERNYIFYSGAVGQMTRLNRRTWWQDPGVSLTNSSAANLTNPISNLALPALNLTSGCGGAGQEITTGCEGSGNGLVNTS